MSVLGTDPISVLRFAIRDGDLPLAIALLRHLEPSPGRASGDWVVQLLLIDLGLRPPGGGPV